MDTAFIELMPFARLVMERLVALKPGDNALILTDTRAHEYRGSNAFVQALMAAARAHGAEPTLAIFTPLPGQVHEPPKPVVQAMRSADVIFTVPTVPLTESQAMRDALAAGARALVFGGAGTAGKDDDMWYRLVTPSLEELERLAGISTAIAAAFKRGKRVHLTSARGTDLWLTIGDLDILNMDGKCDKPGMLQFYVPGLVHAGVTPGSASGRVILDTSLSPVGQLAEPVTLTVEDGFVVKVEGGKEAEAWRNQIGGLNDPNSFNISEFGLGANKRAKLSGKVVEEEAAYGVAHVGFGTDIAFRGTFKAAWHGDGCLQNATVEVGGELICRDGEILLEPAPTS